MPTKLSEKHLQGFLREDEYAGIALSVKAAHEALHSGTGLGNDFIGWLDLPTNYDKEEFARIKAAAKKIQSNSDIFVVIGIGGSYLGARAAIDFIKTRTTTIFVRTHPRSTTSVTPLAPTLLPS